MKADVEKWDSGWFGIALGIRASEIDQLIANLQKMRSENDWHFHMSSDYEGPPNVGDIESYVLPDDDGGDNMTIYPRANN